MSRQQNLVLAFFSICYWHLLIYFYSFDGRENKMSHLYKNSLVTVVIGCV